MLPIVGNVRPGPNGTLPHCRHTLVTWRDPISRFVSGIRTIHARTVRTWCLNQPDFAGTSLCTRISDRAEWQRYATAVLDEVEQILRSCTPLSQAGPQNLAPDFFHILPQWVFLRLLPSPSVVDLRHVGTIQPLCAAGALNESTQKKSATGRPLQLVRNVGEGSRRVLDIQFIDLNSTFQKRLERFFRIDTAIWDLLNASLPHGVDLII